MTDPVVDETQPRPVPAGRMSGRYLVLGFLGFGVVFFVFMLILAQNLDPAADRFHRGVTPSQK